MVRDYGLTSPSLDGILSHDSVNYDGIKRPVVVNRIFDMPSGGRGVDPEDKNNRKVIEDYYNDLYSVLIKKLSHFFVESRPGPEDSVKLIAMLQELIKVKKLLSRKK